VKDLKERTLRGGLAKVASQGASFVLRIGSLMVLARLLTPKDFGLVGMVTVVTGVFALFKDLGLSTATVQKATITDEQVSTLFWLNLLVGALLTALCCAAAPLLVRFYHEPRLLSLTVVLSSGFLINAAGVQHSALLQREMRFGAIAAIEIVALVASIATGIGCAWAGSGHWALVAMSLTTIAASTIGFWIATRWVPGWPRRGAGVVSLMRFGSAVTLNSLVVYLAYNVDKVLLGRFWGAEALGVYGRAYQLINIPTENLNSAVGGVAVSALSRLQDEERRFKGYFLKGYMLVLALTVPATAACALFAHDLIFVVLGDKWMNAVSIFRLLAPTILAFALINPLAWLLVSTGNIGRSVKMAFVIAPLVIVAYAIGLPYGPDGVALGYSAMMMLLAIPMILWATHGLVVSAADIFRSARPAFVSAAVAAAAAVLVSRTIGVGLPPVGRLLLESAVLLIVYLAMLLYVMKQRGFYAELLANVLQRRPAAPQEVSPALTSTELGPQDQTLVALPKGDA
jgi:PST family polysaccharide transporter